MYAVVHPESIFCRYFRWKFLHVHSYRKVKQLELQVLFSVKVLNYIPLSNLFSQVTLRDSVNEELWWSPCLKERSAVNELYHSG